MAESEKIVALARPIVNGELVEKLRNALNLAERGVITNGALVGVRPDGGSVTMVPASSDCLRVLGALRLLEIDVIAAIHEATGHHG